MTTTHFPPDANSDEEDNYEEIVASDNVKFFPGDTRLALHPDCVLKAAIGKLKHVVVIGLEGEGNGLWISTSYGEPVLAQVNMLLDWAKQDCLRQFCGEE